MSKLTTTECLLFLDLLAKPVVAQYDQEHSSSDGGALLLDAADRRLGLIDTLSRCLPDEREAGEVTHELRIAVDADAQMIVATGVIQTPADQQKLLPMIDKVQAITGQCPGRVLADAGYRSKKNLRQLRKRDIDGYVAIGRENGQPTAIGVDQTATLQMARKPRTRRGRDRYRERQWIAEPVFGWIKSCLGFRGFSLRGCEKVTAEWCLVGLAVNLRRLNERMAWTWRRCDPLGQPPRRLRRCTTAQI